MTSGQIDKMFRRLAVQQRRVEKLAAKYRRPSWLERKLGFRFDFWTGLV